jgi:hypothetical protein
MQASKKCASTSMDELSEGVLEAGSPDRDLCGEAETTVTLLQCEILDRSAIVIALPSHSVIIC